MTFRTPMLTKGAESVPPQAWFGISAIFHYLGPSFAVRLFSSVGVIGVAWMRIASAAAVFAFFTRPWRVLREVGGESRRLLIALGACLAAMNTVFYLALNRLPMSLVAAIEFVGTIALAACGVRTGRNLFALAAAAGGVFLQIDVRWSSDPIGLSWAFLNGALFVGYVTLGHRISGRGASRGVDSLGAAMAVALLFVTPIGLPQALPVFGSSKLLLAGIGVGICSSVVPYVCDQLAMSRLPRSTFSLLLALLPATATIMGAVMLAQIPSAKDLLGVSLVMLGVAAHKPAPATHPPAEEPSPNREGRKRSPEPDTGKAPLAMRGVVRQTFNERGIDEIRETR